MESVSALICLGFPLFCVDGKRGEPDDFILDLKSPTMFVVGQSSSNCTVDGMEQLRHRMKAESYLVVVEGAMDSLRMLKYAICPLVSYGFNKGLFTCCINFRWKKKQQNLTQAMVDSTILDELSTFLTNVLSQTSGKDTGKKSPVDRKPDSNSSAAGSSKRPRHSTEPDDGNHAALSGHNYSQKYFRLITHDVKSLTKLFHLLVLNSLHRGKVAPELDWLGCGEVELDPPKIGNTVISIIHKILFFI